MNRFLNERNLLTENLRAESIEETPYPMERESRNRKKRHTTRLIDSIPQKKHKSKHSKKKKKLLMEKPGGAALGNYTRRSVVFGSQISRFSKQKQV